MALFLQSREPLEVGKVYRGFRDSKARHFPNQPYLVLSVATAQDWIECMVLFGNYRDHAEMLSKLDPYFYEISTD